MEKQAAPWVPKEQKPASASPTRVKAGQRKGTAPKDKATSHGPQARAGKSSGSSGLGTWTKTKLGLAKEKQMRGLQD